jgi:tRNA nucleotidyltransferase (CCA-adding enzyme)
MDIYLVGGAVRDTLLGLPVKDRDWVVVGAAPEALLAQGFVPVGKDFPVFLHPQTHEEYALARTERKVAPGYRGFVVHASPDVTLEADLSRRDLSINAMALPHSALRADGSFDPDTAALIDPFGGRHDVRHKILRHVGSAFVEDPLRILRVARLAAYLPGFALAPATKDLLRHMAQSGETAHLAAARVWQELAKGLMTQHPERLVQVLQDCGAWEQLLAGCRADAQLLCVSAKRQDPLPVRTACLLKDLALTSTATALAHWLQQRHWPKAIGELTMLMQRELPATLHSAPLQAAALVALLNRCDAFRKPDRMAQLLQISATVQHAQTGHAAPTPALLRLKHAWAVAQALPLQTLTRQAQSRGIVGPALGMHINQARVAAVQAQLPAL